MSLPLHGTNQVSVTTGDIEIGQVKLLDSGGTNVGAIDSAGGLRVWVAPQASNSSHRSISASNTVTTVKASAGALKLIEASNSNLYDVFLQIWDHASPVIATDTPKFSFLVPGGVTANTRGGMDKIFMEAIAFSTAITYAVTREPSGPSAPERPITINMLYN